MNEVKGEIVHGEMHEMNTFETPDQVRVKELMKLKRQQRELNSQFLMQCSSPGSEIIKTISRFREKRYEREAACVQEMSARTE